MVQPMAKIYTVSAGSTYVPTHFGGGRAARKIDTVPNPLNQEGLSLTLSAEFVKHAVCVPSAGHEAQIAFSALHPAIHATDVTEDNDGADDFMIFVADRCGDIFDEKTGPIFSPKHLIADPAWTAILERGIDGTLALRIGRVAGLGMMNRRVRRLAD